MRLHHVQLSMPAGREDDARRFYGAALELTEVPKPAALAGRGGVWFRSFDGDRVLAEIHLGVDDGAQAPAKAHPGLVVDSVEALDALAETLLAAGHEVSWAERTTFDGYERFHCRDPFGNRIEIMTPAAPREDQSPT